MNAINNQINYKQYYQEYLAKHPRHAKLALGFVPLGPDAIKIYLDGGDYILWNFTYRRMEYVENEIATSTRQRVGRPKKKDAMSKRLTVRMTDEDYEKLDYITRRTGKNASDIFREAINNMYRDTF